MSEKYDAVVEREINNTLQMLSQFTTQNITDDKVKKLVLLVGLTGTGKSTVASYLAREPDIKVTEKYSEYVVIGPRIGQKNSVSQTLYPELVQIRFNNTKQQKDYTLVDCPGFEDTRSPSIDIAVTVFIKTILSMADWVKFAIVAQYDDLKNNGGRTRLKTLTEQMNAFFNPTTKLKDNIGIIVNKVTNGKTKKSIIDYLNDEYADPNRDELLNIITRDGGERMEFFHLANKTGSIEDIDFLKADRDRIFDMIDNKLEFFETKKHQFGNPISANTFIYLSKITNRIYRDMILSIQELSSKLDELLKPSGGEEVFYNIVKIMTGLDMAVIPRTNLLQQLLSHVPEVSTGLKMHEYFLELMKQLPSVGSETQMNEEIVRAVGLFRSSTENKLQERANKLHDAISSPLNKCFDDILNVKQNTQKLPSQYSELETLLFKELERLVTIMNSFSGSNQSIMQLLKLIDGSLHPNLDACNTIVEKIDKIQNTNYVDGEKTKKSIEKVKSTMREVQNQVIKSTLVQVWTKFMERVNNQVGQFDTALQTKFQAEVARFEEQEDRRLALAKYLVDLKDLATADIEYAEFEKKMMKFAIWNEIEPNFTSLHEDFEKLSSKPNEKVKTTIEKKRNWGKPLETTLEYVQNSAPTQGSFINAAVRWVHTQVTSLLPGKHSANHATSRINVQFSDFNPTLLLIDLIVRQFTGKKPQTSIAYQPVMNNFEVQAHTLNIIEACEVEYYRHSDVPVDFTSIQKMLHKRLSQLEDPEDVVLIKDEMLRMMHRTQSTLLYNEVI